MEPEAKSFWFSDLYVSFDILGNYTSCMSIKASQNQNKKVTDNGSRLMSNYAVRITLYLLFSFHSYFSGTPQKYKLSIGCADMIVQKSLLPSSQM